MLLFVGEGDFTFAWSICRDRHKTSKSDGMLSYLLTGLQSDATIAATSFDSESAVLAKYRDSPLAKLHDLDNTIVRHGVDATDRSTYPNGDILRVVWNHPHLGIEDAQYHESLMDHFLHEAGKTLLPGGDAMISLLEGQADRWHLKDVLDRQGFEFVIEPFLLPTRMGYLARRNEVGRSFRNTDTARRHGVSVEHLQSWVFVCGRKGEHHEARHALSDATSWVSVGGGNRIDERKRVEAYRNKSLCVRRYLQIPEDAEIKSPLPSDADIVARCQRDETENDLGVLAKSLACEFLPDRDVSIASSNKNTKKIEQNMRELMQKGSSEATKLSIAVAYLVRTAADATLTAVPDCPGSCWYCGAGQYPRWQSLLTHVNQEHILRVGARREKPTEDHVTNTSKNQVKRRKLCPTIDQDRTPVSSCSVCIRPECSGIFKPYQPEALLCSSCDGRFKDGRALQQHSLSCVDKSP